MSSAERFQQALLSLPAPGGNGCHPALLGAANLGVLAGLDDRTIFDSIRQAIKQGKRHVGDREIQDAITTARRDCQPGSASSISHQCFRPPPARQPALVVDAFERVTSMSDLGEGDPQVRAMERSPAPIDWEPEAEAVMVLPRLYRPDDLLCCGNQYAKGIPGETLLTCSEWGRQFQGNIRPPEYVSINPLSGKQGVKKDGGLSYRCDDAVARFPYVLVEFDSRPVGDQIRFFLASGMPIACLTHSGSKSCHALVRVDAEDRPSWETAVARLYALLKPMQADTSNANPARFTRLPGGWRPEKQAWQRVIYLGV